MHGEKKTVCSHLNNILNLEGNGKTPVKNSQWSMQTNDGLKPESYNKKIKYFEHFNAINQVFQKININKQSNFNCESIVDVAWQTIEEGYEKYTKQYPNLIFHKENKESFRKLFNEMYENVMDEFMYDTNALDSHKQAAILTISCLRSNAIEHILDDKTEISIIPQLIAINVGFSYMKNCINDILKENGIKRTITHYYFPVPLACDTPYPEVICRLLYHEQKEGHFNVLELSDRYFLLEYLNLLQQGIEPCQIKAGSKNKKQVS